MDKDKVRITQHAIDKFLLETRNLGGGGNVKTPEQQIKQLFKQSKKQEMDAALVKRIIKNGYQSTQYFIVGKWRFVIVEDTMVTCERVYYKQPKRRRR